MADQVNHETPEGFFLTEEEEVALATALSTTDVAQTASVSATSETLLSPGGAWAVPDSAPTANPDSGSGSSSGWAPPGDYYQPNLRVGIHGPATDLFLLFPFRLFWFVRVRQMASSSMDCRSCLPTSGTA